MKAKAFVVATIILISFLAAVPVATGSNQLGFIKDINASWGTSGNSVGASPGSQNLPLTVTLQYVYPETASSIQGVLYLPKGFSLYDGTNITFTSTSQSVSEGEVFQMTFNSIFIASNLTLGTYNFPLTLWVYSGGSLILNQTSTIAVSVEGEPQLQVTSTTESLAAGQVDSVPLTIHNSGTGSASDITISASSPGGVLNSIPKIQNLSAGGNASVTSDVFVPSSAEGTLVPLTITSTYTDPYGISGSSSQIVEFFASATSPTLEFSANPLSLQPGQVNNVTLTLTNTGSTGVTQVSVTASLPTQSGLVLTQPSQLLSLAAGEKASWVIEMFIPASAAGSILQLTLATTSTDSTGISQISSQTIGLFVTSAPSTASLSVTPLVGEANVGAEEPISFTVKNTGSSPVESPTFSLTVSSPLVVTRNSTYSMQGSIQPGQSVVYEATIASETSATPGFYTDAVTVTFEDSLGVSVTNSYSLGLTLGGNIQLVIQDATATQSGSTLVVSGTLLNEGFSSAYYTTVTGSIGSSKTEVGTYYVGELDPDTPLAFSVTIPIAFSSRSGTSMVNLTVGYKDSIGLQGSYYSSLPASLQSTVTTATATTAISSGITSLNLLEYGIVAILVVVVVVGFILVRRNRRGTGAAYHEPEEREDKAVI